jgi:hypothetical protein
MSYQHVAGSIAMAKPNKMASGHSTQTSGDVAADADAAVSCEGLHSELQAQLALLQDQLKTARAEAKIHKDAWTSEADKSAALSAQLDREAHDKAALSAKLVHISKLLRAAELAYYEQATTQTNFDADGWREMYQKLVRAVMLLFLHRD